MEIGRRLERFAKGITESHGERRQEALLTLAGGEVGTDGIARVGLLFQMERISPGEREEWKAYRGRVEKELLPRGEEIQKLLGVDCRIRICANTFAAEVPLQQAVSLAEKAPDLPARRAELDPVVQLTEMDDAVLDISLDEFLARRPGTTGNGVRVAVIDSGVDMRHPFLRVEVSRSTCGEAPEIPGRHGTHCAGSVASRHASFRGVAPGVTLLNVKALRSNGSGSFNFVTAGIDEALELDAQVLSLSLGFNHLPTWSDRGHGWDCGDGRCALCVAVDNASLVDRRIVVVAAGNEHERAESLRRHGHGGSFDTEFGCPGQGRAALSVGAHTKRSFEVASFSSRGNTSYGASKPDLYAPGVNVTSTVPVPRDDKGNPLVGPEWQLFGRESGTSMATPIVAGAAALVIERLGAGWTREAVIRELLATATPLPNPPPGNSAGRLDLARL